jgi:hypothetical protein
VLEALQAGIARQLAVLDDASLTGTGQSSSDALELPRGVLAEKLTGHLLQEIIARGSRGGPLFPLASQLNDDVTHLELQELGGAVRRLAENLREALGWLAGWLAGWLDGAGDVEAVPRAGSDLQASPGLILDIGSVSAPNKAFDLGEVRFSISNYSDAPLKITSIALRVAERRESTAILTRVPLAPVDKYFLFAEVVQGKELYELLDRHHLLQPLETDGFFLKSGRVARMMTHVDRQLAGE